MNPITKFLRLLAVLGLLVAAAGMASANPQRIVSINLCADVLVLYLAPRASIASVSFLASDPRFSPMVEEARGIPVNNGKAEEVLSLQADLVVAGRYSGQNTVRLLRALGYPVVELAIPTSIGQAREQILELSAALGVYARGNAVLRRLDARMAAVRAIAPNVRPLAVIYQPNGFTAGSGSLADDLLDWTGFDNLAARAGIRFWGDLSLEQLLLSKPDLLILDRSDPLAPSLAQRLLGHPALSHLAIQLTILELPARYWSCAGPWIADVAEELAAARGALIGRHAFRNPAAGY